MSELYAPTGSHSRESSRNEGQSSEEAIQNDNGWSDPNWIDDLSEAIKSINSKIPLDFLFKKYKIKFESVGYGNGWSQRALCPFPDHKEKTASFGFNPDLNRFNCFGCHRGGSTVDFYSIIEDKPINEAVSSLINFAKSQDSLFQINSFDIKQVFDLLYKFANDLKSFKDKNPTEKSYKYAEAISWGIDLYIQKNLPEQNIDFDELKARLEKAKEQLTYFKD